MLSAYWPTFVSYGELSYCYWATSGSGGGGGGRGGGGSSGSSGGSGSLAAAPDSGLGLVKRESTLHSTHLETLTPTVVS